MPLTASAPWRDSFPDVPADLCPLMITLPAGEFMMGSLPDEPGYDDSQGPRHAVRIAYPFALGQFPITLREWYAAERAGASSLETWPSERELPQDWPVVGRYCEEVESYIAWLNESLGLVGKPDAYRLPSEAEWEYACRAGTTTPYYCGNTIDATQACFAPRDKIGGLVPVGSYPPNPFGLHDMHGLVFEWCADWWMENYEGAPTDGSPATTQGDEDYRPIRGGSWRNWDTATRSAYRDRQRHYYREDEIGFRVARTLTAITPSS